MSPKELSYIQDALGHEKHLYTKCLDCVASLQDMELKSFVQQLAAQHQQRFNQLYQLLQ
ncbi:MAG: hypothetical protein VB085_01120 [Peptococcaceae bacterium]|nr:hypothetical protein [Peptococcaceae bacterium]